MAVAFSPGLDDEEEKKKAELSSQSGMLNSGGQASASAPGTSSGRWTNMMSYVDANKNSTMGNTIEGKLDVQNQGAQGELGSKVKDISGYTADKSLRGQSGVPSNLIGSPQNVQKSDVDKVKSFQGQGFADGANPFLQGAQNAQKKIQDIQDTSSDVGRVDNLQGFFGKDDQGKQAQYSGGEKNLDSFILNNNANGQSAVSKIRDKFKNIGGAAQQTVDAQKADVAKARQDSEATQGSLGSATGQLKDWSKGFQDSAAQRAKDFNNQQSIERFDYSSALLPGAGKSAQKAIMDKTGMSADEVSAFIQGGGNPAELLQAGDTAVASDFVNEEDAARYQSLASLGILDPASFDKARSLSGNKVNQGAIEASKLNNIRNASIAASQADYDQNGMGGVYIPEGSELDLKTKASIAERKRSADELRQILASKGKPKSDVEYVPAGELEPVNGPQEKGRASRLGRSGTVNGRSNGF